MPAAKTHPTLATTRALHRSRSARHFYPDIEDDAALASAYHSLQLHWIASVPGYREALKEKLSEAARKAERRAHRIEQSQRTLDGGLLGQLLREEELERMAGY